MDQSVCHYTTCTKRRGVILNSGVRKIYKHGNGQLSHKEYMNTGLPASEAIVGENSLRTPPPPAMIRRENRKAQKRYGKNCNCKSGACYYSFRKGGYLCATTMLHPKLILIFMAVAIAQYFSSRPSCGY